MSNKPLHVICIKLITNKVVLCFVRGSVKYVFLFILVSQLSLHPLPTISSENREYAVCVMNLFLMRICWTPIRSYENKVPFKPHVRERCIMPVWSILFPRLDAFSPQKRLKKSSCVSSPEAQIEDRCLPAFTDGNARLLTCGVLWGRKYGAFSQQLSVVAHASSDAYASHVAETVEGFKYKRVIQR
jgi:hypothetical protein